MLVVLAGRRQWRIAIVQWRLELDASSLRAKISIFPQTAKLKCPKVYILNILSKKREPWVSDDSGLFK
jgi:hypothetical protein